MAEQLALFFPSTDVRRTRADQIFAAFKRFHAENQIVWDLFAKYTMEIVRGGHKNFGAKAVFERIRWYTTLETTNRIKLNNNYTSYYARMFVAKFPQYAEFFRNRERISENSGPATVDIQEWSAAPPAGEDELMEELRNL